MPGTIVTKYIGPTDHKPGRVKALSSGGQSLVVSWDHALDVTDNHRAAARALASKLMDAVEYGWSWSIDDEAGLLPDSVGWAYVFYLRSTSK